MFQIIGLFLFFLFAAMAVMLKVADTPLVASVLCASDASILETVAGCGHIAVAEDPAGDTTLPLAHTELALAATNAATPQTIPAAPAGTHASSDDNTSRIILVLERLDALLNAVIFNQRTVQANLDRLNERIDAISDHTAAQSSEDRDDLRDQIAGITDDATFTGSLTLPDLTGGLLTVDVDGHVSTTSAGAFALEDLSDVASMTETAGDLLYWNGSAWSNIATSSLGLASPITGTSTEIAFFGGDGSLTSSSNYVYDGSNVGIGTLQIFAN